MNLGNLLTYFMQEGVLQQTKALKSHTESLAHLLSHQLSALDAPLWTPSEFSPEEETYAYCILDASMEKLHCDIPADDYPTTFPKTDWNAQEVTTWFDGSVGSGLAVYALAPLRESGNETVIQGYVLAHAFIGTQDKVIRIHDVFNVDVSVFYQDWRVATTVRTATGYALGTKLDSTLATRLLSQPSEYLGDVQVLGVPYLAMYKSFGNPGEPPIGILSVGESLERFRSIQLSMIALVSFLGLALLLVTLMFSRMWLHRNIVLPLNQTSDTLSKVASGDPDFEKKLNTYPKYLEFNQLNQSIIRMVRELTESRRQIEEIAFIDDLTRLPNRHSLFKRYLGDSALPSRLKYLFCLDLDHLQTFNNLAGHLVGDHLIQHVGMLLLDLMPSGRDQETYRIGGGEFIVCLSQENEKVDLETFVQSVRTNLLQPFRYEEHALDVPVSIGVASCETDSDTIGLLLQNAETAMHEAKACPDLDYVLYCSEMGDGRRLRKELGMELKLALEHAEFFLVYQPKQDLRTGRCYSCEALIRWNHPLRGLVSPADFIGIAEETGFIIPMGTWVLEESCATLDRLQARFGKEISMSVNISSLQLTRDDFVRMMLGILLRNKLQPEQLELEITESVLIGSFGSAIDKLRQLHALGIGISIDDFGKGYSSLSYLRNLPISTLKIDKLFVDEIGDGQDILLGDIIQLGRHLNLKTVAEGVETEEQREFLMAAQCDAIQGYHYSRPLRESDLFRFLEAEQERSI